MIEYSIENKAVVQNSLFMQLPSAAIVITAAAKPLFPHKDDGSADR